jgi:hypothetical protein
MRPFFHAFMLASLHLAIACGDDDATDGGADAGLDGGPSDAGMPDAGEPDAGPFMPTSYCPGSADCPDEGDGVLHVGAAAIDITPVVDDTAEVMTVDVNGNGEYEPSDGDEFRDVDGDGVFDGIWIAGYGNARSASGVSDPQWARAIVLRHNATTVALVSIDCVGFFWDDVVRVRERVADLDVDYVMVAATHSHEARDTMGQWGQNLESTGIDLDYMDRIYDSAAQAIRDALASAAPATAQYARTRLRDQEGGTTRYVSDSRDPYILDDEIRIVRFADVEMGTTIATLVNFASHPEYAGSDNTLLSSDWVNWLREGVESGLVGPDGEMVEGVGGVAVFYQGALGCQIGPNRLEAVAWDGTKLGSMDSLVTSETVGTQLAYFVLTALGDGGGSVTDDTAAVGFRNREVYLDVKNTMYHIAIGLGLFPTRMGYNFDPSRPISRANEPDLRTEVAVIDIGRMQIMAVPGELDPALFVGGYDGSYTPEGVLIVDTAQENAPNLAMAPAGPYLKDLARADAEYVALFGLANDEIGYFVLPWDYQLNSALPYLAEAPGDHYEETNSIGPDGWPDLDAALRALLAWTP